MCHGANKSILIFLNDYAATNTTTPHDSFLTPDPTRPLGSDSIAGTNQREASTLGMDDDIDAHGTSTREPHDKEASATVQATREDADATNEGASDDATPRGAGRKKKGQKNSHEQSEKGHVRPQPTGMGAGGGEGECGFLDYDDEEEAEEVVEVIGGEPVEAIVRGREVKLQRYELMFLGSRGESRLRPFW